MFIMCDTIGSKFGFIRIWTVVHSVIYRPQILVWSYQSEYIEGHFTNVFVSIFYYRIIFHPSDIIFLNNFLGHWWCLQNNHLSNREWFLRCGNNRTRCLSRCLRVMWRRPFFLGYKWSTCKCRWCKFFFFVHLSLILY